MFVSNAKMWAAAVIGAAFGFTAQADDVKPLTFHWGTYDGAPYVLVENGKLVGGVIKDQAEAIGRELKHPIRFMELPRKRVSMELNEGNTHIYSIMNPAWADDSEKLSFSDPLYYETEHFVGKKEVIDTILGWNNLRGKNVGTTFGFHYPPELQGLFDQGISKRIDAVEIEGNYKQLEAGIVDLLIDKDIVIDYRKASGKFVSHLAVSSLIVAKNGIHLAVSPKAPVAPEKVVAAANKLKANGTIEQILSRYGRKTS